MPRNRLAPPKPRRVYSVKRGNTGRWIVCPASEGVAFPAMTRAQAQREADWRNRHEGQTGRWLGQ